MSYEITDEQIAGVERMNVELNELKCVVRYIRVDEVEAIISRLRKAEKDVARYQRALQEIIDIELQEFGADWEEIEEAQEIAESAMKGEQQ